VHLELVSDLSSNTSTAALKRFIPRKGICKQIYCDNGKNNVWAARSLIWMGDQKQRKNRVNMSTRFYRVQFHTTKCSTHWWTVVGLCEVRQILLAQNHVKWIFNLWRSCYSSFSDWSVFQLKTDYFKVQCLKLWKINDSSTFFVDDSILLPIEQDRSDMQMNKLQRWR